MTKPPSPSRRRLIAHAATAGAAGVAAAVLGPAAGGGSTAAVPQPKAQPRASGYRETDHTRTYYRLARY